MQMTSDKETGCIYRNTKR